MQPHYFFNWIDRHDLFDAVKHRREDLKILNLQIFEREGNYPSAKLIVPNNRAWKKHSWAMITCLLEGEVVLLFKGCLSGLPMGIDGETIQIELVAEPGDAHAQTQLLCENLKRDGNFNPLFLPLEKQGQPDLKDLLDGRMDIPYWSRDQLKLSLTNLFWGCEYKVFEGQHFYDSLRIRLAQQPVGEIEVQVGVRWKQTAFANCRLDHVIQAHLPSGLLSTLTGVDLETHWWKNGTKIDYTGYKIEQTDLEKVTPPQTGVLNLYPRLSRPMSLSPHDPHNKSKNFRNIRLKRDWFRPRLKVSWRYRQSRYENACFVLKNNLQTNAWEGRRRLLKLQVHLGERESNLRPWVQQIRYDRGDKIAIDHQVYVCLKNHRSSESFSQNQGVWHCLGDRGSYETLCFGEFFPQEQGQKVLQKALEIATARLAMSSRALEIAFECSFKDAISLNCNQSLALKDHRLPAGEVRGKIRSIEFKVDGKTGTSKAEVILACGIGVAHELSHAADLIEPMSVSSLEALEPSQGHLYPHLLSAADLVKEIEIVNDAAQQEAYLLENQYPKHHHLFADLGEVKTRLRLVLEDMRTTPLLIQRYKVHLTKSWSAPNQVYITQEGEE